MSTISVQEIQRDLSAFLRRVEAGESFLVVSGENPLAEVRPVSAPARIWPAERRFLRRRGMIRVGQGSRVDDVRRLCAIRGREGA